MAIFSDLTHRVKKVGQPPGTAVYTGKKTKQPASVTAIYYDAEHCTVKTGSTLEAALTDNSAFGTAWINLSGLANVDVVQSIASQFNLHPLTVEDILNTSQRPKIEEFDHYIFITLRVLLFKDKSKPLAAQQLSIVFGKDFVLTFEESSSGLIDPIAAKLQGAKNQRLREQKSDYLVYRLIDAVVDAYFLVLEDVGDQIEAIEKDIIDSPTQKNMRLIYRMKRQLLILRKIIWPLREVISHLLYEENDIISRFTRLYFRDAYDHIAQAIDSVETFRDMLSNLLDVYLSSLSMRTNEIMKTLTIITTIFIPITAVASIYGMNLVDIPLMKSRLGFYVVAAVMVFSVGVMLLYFRRKKWM
jgi:magnesium transporter